ncbi:MAG: M20/M25/M40 family metallo-hydrolase [Bacteroidota bacterium]|jgi:cytochrome c-type biogenesis protein CcmE
MKTNRLFILFTLVSTLAFAQDISIEKLQKHIGFLASDSLHGRGTGTPDEQKAAAYIASAFRDLGLGYLPGQKEYVIPFSFRKTKDPHGNETDTTAPRTQSMNVAGLINCNKPYTICIGAHFDHLGLGHDKNSLDANPEGKIHNGADDNASGVAGILELARYYSGARKNKLRYNLAFVCFSGEELGLIGSKKFVEANVLDTASIQLMINLDMVGRLNDSTQKVMVYGTGTSLPLHRIADEANQHLVLVKDSSGMGPSDHTSFYLKRVPVLHFFTGQHKDYHKPDDDAAKINYPGEKKVLEYIAGVIDRVNEEPKMAFLKTRDAQSGQKVSFKVTLGIMPDYSFEGKGIKVDGVTEGKPAFRAGVLQGDIILQLGEISTADMSSYMKALGTFQKGSATRVKVSRKGEEKWLEVTF